MVWKTLAVLISFNHFLHFCSKLMMDRWMDAWKIRGLMDRHMEGWMDGYMEGRMDRYMEGRMDRYMDRCTIPLGSKMVEKKKTIYTRDLPI